MIERNEFRRRLARAGMRQSDLARCLGVHPSTVYRWAAGDIDVPQYAVAYLALAIELHSLGERIRDIRHEPR